jgi:hypothetical protein
LHLRHPLKLQIELAPVRAGQFFYFAQPPLEFVGASRSVAAIAGARTFGSSARGCLSVLIFSHQVSDGTSEFSTADAVFCQQKYLLLDDLSGPSLTT